MTNSFKQAMETAGLAAPADIIPDGTFHRFHVTGDRPRSKNGWYVFYGDDPPAGFFGCWKRGIKETWSSKPTENLSPAERADLRARMEATKTERERLQAEVNAEAQKKAAKIWRLAEPAPADHPYLTKKGIKPYGLRTSWGSLVAPLRDTAGTLHGLQFISQDGGKKYFPGTKKIGAYLAIGVKPDSVLCLCEGYATGASIHEATGHPVAVAFDAGNLQPVAEALRAKLPGIRIIVCGDNDAWTKGNPGATKAREAAAAVNGLLALPTFQNTIEKPTDFNDLHRLEELEEVRRQIEAAEFVCDEEPAYSLGVVRGSEVKVEPINWLWYGWLASGKLHVLAGAPGTGKTTLALNLAAILTNASQWPDGSPAPLAEVAIWSGEDDAADTLVPRLMAAGANLQRIHIVQSVGVAGDKRPFDPAKDMPRLAAYFRINPAIKLLIIDPIVSAVAGDSHKNTEVRRNLQPLVDLAAECGCAILGISHFSKGTSGRDPLERVTGSIAFGALARVVLAVAKLADDEEGKRLFARAKSNIGPDDGGWHYRLDTCELDEHAGVITSRVSWCGVVEGSARELLSSAETTEDNEENTARGEAKVFLLDALTNGPVAVRKILADAKANGISERTLKRAKAELNVDVQKTGMAGGWQWSLPPKEAKKPEECQQN